jgi:hypothetical protein
LQTLLTMIELTYFQYPADQSGLQAIRMFTPCTDGTCDIVETPSIHLTSNRWYPSASRLDDGSVFIFGGSLGGGHALALYLCKEAK